MASIHKQAVRSGLAFLGCDIKDVPQWSTTEWPPLARYGHAAVVVDHDNAQQTVVVTGGYEVESHWGYRQNESYVVTNSVLLMTVGDEKKWEEGPRLIDERAGHVSVVCGGSVYVLGGRDGCALGGIRSIEKIDISNLVPSKDKRWTTASCILSKTRYDCAATAVHDRYIVIVGGYSSKPDNYEMLSSIEIIDTAMDNYHAAFSGPSLNIARKSCGISVVGRRIYVTGGCGDLGYGWLDSVEYFEFNDSPMAEIENTRTTFPSSRKWKMLKELSLSVPRSEHDVVRVGSCLIVGGGKTKIVGQKMVEVLDTNGNHVWHLPSLNWQEHSTMVATAKGIIVIGGKEDHLCTFIPLVTRKQELKVRVLLKPLLRTPSDMNDS